MAVKIKIVGLQDNIAQLNQLILELDIIDGTKVVRKTLEIDGAADKEPEDIEKILEDKLKNLQTAQGKMTKFQSLVGKEIK